MGSNQQHPQSVPFWDWIQSLENQGHARGVDNSASSFAPFMAGFPFGPGYGGSGGPRGPPHEGHPHHPRGPPPHEGHPHHPRGPHPPPPPPGAEDLDWGAWFHTGPYGGPNGRNNRRNESMSEAGAATPTTEQDKNESSETVTADVPDPDEVTPEEDHCGSRPHGVGRGRGRPHRGGPCRGGRGGRGGPGPHHGPGSHHPPPYPGQAFDLSSMFRGMASHPLFRNFRDLAQPNQESTDPDAFTPPVDVFNTEKTFVLHVALPGAKKDDVGVNWDAERGVLKIAGVVHRPGDEEFLKTLTKSERTVGVFERNVTLPPDGKDEVDGFGITAKMEDGVLVITVPKAEKEWTEIHKVDIE